MDAVDDIETEIRELTQRRRAHLRAARSALAEARRQPLVSGSNEQPRGNPLFRVAQESDRLALEIGETLRELRAAAKAAAVMAPFAELDRTESSQ